MASDIEAVLGSSPRPLEKLIQESEDTSLNVQPSPYVWACSSGLSDDQPLERHFEILFEFIEKNLTVLKGLEEKCCLVVSCSYASQSGQGGFTLSNDLLKKLSQLPVNLEVRLFPPGQIQG